MITKATLFQCILIFFVHAQIGKTRHFYSGGMDAIFEQGGRAPPNFANFWHIGIFFVYEVIFLRRNSVFYDIKSPLLHCQSIQNTMQNRDFQLFMPSPTKP